LKDLINPDGNFTAVYGLYHHDQFGYLIGAYVVEKNDAGNLTLKYQRLLPENFENFASKLDEKDRKLTHLLYEISLNGLYKQFGTKDSSFQQFVNKFDNNVYKQIIIDYIDRRKAEAFTLLEDKNFYLKSRDGYPAWRKLDIVHSKTDIKFLFRRNEKETLYSAKLIIDGREENLNAEYSGILVHSPGWLLWNDKILPLEENIDTKKLIPFTKRPHISIPQSSEKEYFEKILLRLIEYHEVELHGIDVEKTSITPKIQLVITKDNPSNIYTFRLAACYGQLRLWIRKPLKRVHAYWEYKNNIPKLYITKRDTKLESIACDHFSKLRNDEIQLFDFGLNADKAFAWLEKNYPRLVANGIEVVQEFDGEKLSFDCPVLSAYADKTNTGYLIHAGISFGNQWIPLNRIKENVLNFEQKFTVNQNQAILLPQSWLENLRLLFEIAEEDETGKLHVLLCHAGVIRSAFRDIKVSGFNLFDTFDKIRSVQIPTNFNAELREYQKAGYDWLCFLHEFGLNGILADDMGLGKTVQTLALLQKVKEDGGKGTHLIVAPNSLVFNWSSEIKRFVPDMKVLEHYGPKRDKSLKNKHNYDIVITTYGIVRQDEEYLAKHTFDYIILDECQYIKNNDTKTTQAIFRLKSKSRLALTGTPIENSTMDLWTQINFLNPGMLGTNHFFEKHYSIPIEKENSVKKRDELKAIIHPIVLRRTKEMVAKDLPDKVIDCIYAEMTNEQEKLYRETTALYKSTLFGEKSDVHKTKLQILAGLQRLRQIAIHPQMIDPTKKESGKYAAVRDLMFRLYESGEKVLVFSQFVKFLSILKYDLIKDKIKFSYLDGTTKDRKTEVKRFQDDDSTKIFLISLKAGGVGLNLTAARYILLVDPWWNPAAEMQAVSRAHRIGQYNTVFVYKFITRGSIEEKIIKLQEYKSKLAEEVIKSESSFFKSLDKKELMDLFE
jgi:superfamily II DNA or RNA helicase